MSLKETNKYDDIIGLPHPTSLKHPRMAAIDRAAQFSPFSALVEGKVGSKSKSGGSARGPWESVETRPEPESGVGMWVWYECWKK